MRLMKFKCTLSMICTVAFIFMANGLVFSQESSEELPLYERLGGLAPISIVVSDFVDQFILDPVIMSNPAVRERKTAETAPYIKFQVTTMVCQVTGGPCQYTGLDMSEAHRGLNVSEREWDRMVEIFVGTLEKYQVPEKETEEILSIMGTTKDDIVVAGSQ